MSKGVSVVIVPVDPSVDAIPNKTVFEKNHNNAVVKSFGIHINNDTIPPIRLEISVISSFLSSIAA